jgi:hypothetical protein
MHNSGRNPHGDALIKGAVILRSGRSAASRRMVFNAVRAAILRGSQVLAPQDDGGVCRTIAPQLARISALIMSAAFSPIMMVGALVLPPIKVGMTDASTTRRPSRP